MSPYSNESVTPDPTPNARELAHARALAHLVANESAHPMFIDGLSEFTLGMEVSNDRL